MTSALKLKPVITAVTDSKGNQIPNGGTTKDTTVSAKGHSGPGQEIKLYNNDTLVFSTMAGPSGNWVGPLTGLAAGLQALKAVSDGHVSAVWSFAVVLPK